MFPAFVVRPPFISQYNRKHVLRCPISSRTPGPQSSHNCRVRVLRKYTSKSANWEWNGRKSSGWRSFFNVEEGVLKVIEALWVKSLRVSESPILARMTALGARVLKRVTNAIARTLCPDAEKDLIVEYGLAEPNPDDKNYVDPLREWDTSNITYYRDSFGRRVYLQLDGASGLVAATDYRDLFEEGELVDDDNSDDDIGESQPFSILGHDGTFLSPDSLSGTFEFDDRPDWTYDPTLR